MQSTALEFQRLFGQTYRELVAQSSGDVRLQELARQQLQQGYYAQYQSRLPGYGVVREIRAIELQNGENTIRFTDVASGIPQVPKR